MAQLSGKIPRELQVFLSSLTFDENFQCVIKEDVVLSSSGETKIVNPFQEINKQPKYYLILRKNKAGDVYDGSTAWSNNYIYLDTDAASDLTVTIAFFIR